MKILLSHPYFAPDTPPYGQMLAQISAALSGDGHSVLVYSARRSYRGKVLDLPAKEVSEGIEIQRVLLPQNQMIAAVLYAMRLFWIILIKRPDAVMAASAPPVIAGFMAALSAKLTGAKMIYHLQDIHPEVSASMGFKSGKGWRARLLRRADNFTLKQAKRIIVLSHDMKETLKARSLDELPITVLNNFARAIPPQIPAPKWHKPIGKRRVIFAGNLGKFQALEAVSDGLLLACAMRPDLEIMWLGDGAKKGTLEQIWDGHSQVIFAPQLPEAQANWLLEEADVGIVSLDPGIFKTSYPSKLLSYKACNLPILALVEHESALACDIKAQNLGLTAPNASSDAIANTLLKLLDEPKIEGSERARDAQKKALNRWCELFGELS